jgi:hypothetical protein
MFVIPAKAGIHIPVTKLYFCLRRNDKFDSKITETKVSVIPLLQECVKTSFPPLTSKLIYPSQVPLHEIFTKLSNCLFEYS